MAFGLHLFPVTNLPISPKIVNPNGVLFGGVKIFLKKTIVITTRAGQTRRLNMRRSKADLRVQLQNGDIVLEVRNLEFGMPDDLFDSDGHFVRFVFQRSVVFSQRCSDFSGWESANVRILIKNLMTDAIYVWITLPRVKITENDDCFGYLYSMIESRDVKVKLKIFFVPRTII